jgi:hypothetical protein
VAANRSVAARPSRGPRKNTARSNKLLSPTVAAPSPTDSKPERRDVADDVDPRGDPILTIRAARAHGDVEISTHAHGADAEEFLRRARDWFEAQPERLLLIGDAQSGPPAASLRKVTVAYCTRCCPFR